MSSLVLLPVCVVFILYRKLVAYDASGLRLKR
jgi:hypothetical protein